MKKKLMRSEKNGQLAGVAAGVADYFDFDVTIVRLLFILFTIAGGPGIFAYLIAALVIPTEESMVGEQIHIEKGPMVA
jgi:phage shock protein C